jgi:hypothetical protein
MKCDKCGVTDNGTGDWAHVCGPVKVKKSGMNERIRELAEQATTIVDIVGPQGFTSSYANFDREKFAELLIQQCCNAIVNDSRLSDVRTARNGCVRAIKEHFGVEE